MSENADFENITASEGFDFVRHNEKNFAGFNDFYADLTRKYEKINREKQVKTREANIRRWDESLPPAWRGADLATIKNPAAKTVTGMITERGFSSFFLKGAVGVGKTFFAYAIAREYIRRGWTSPSKIKIVTEDKLLMTSKLGFDGWGKINDEILSGGYNLYIFENVGSREDYTSFEKPIWETILDHIESDNAKAIFTSTGSYKMFLSKLSGPARAKLDKLVHDGQVEIPGKGRTLKIADDYTDSELEQIKREEQELTIFDSFKD